MSKCHLTSYRMSSFVIWLGVQVVGACGPAYRSGAHRNGPAPEAILAQDATVRKPGMGFHRAGIPLHTKGEPTGIGPAL